MSATVLRSSRDDLRKGWCPSLFEPMESGDGLIVRLKPHAATVDAAAVRAIAGAATRHGNGIVEITNRANIQIRGARPETVAPITAMALRLQLAAQDPAVERIRSVMASPLGPDDPHAAFDSHALAADIEHMLAQEPALAALPAKFGFLVDGGGRLSLAGVSTDIAVRPAPGGLQIEIAGADVVAETSLVGAVSLVRRLALAFVALSARTSPHARRMRDLVARLGGGALFAEAGLSASGTLSREQGAAQPIGFLPLAASSGAFGIGFPFGQIGAPAFAALADLAVTFGDGTLRATPWRAMMIAGVASDTAPRLAGCAKALGLITDPVDSRRRISACPGKPACGNATVETRTDAATLAAHDIDGVAVHVSGCAKGCAHPGPAGLTLVGGNGRYDLVLDGRAGDPPVASGLALDEALSAFNLLRRLK